jgi:hypothetical protein
MPNQQVEGSTLAGADDLHRVLGDLEDAKMLEILALSPTVAEVEVAGIWADGQGDVADRAGWLLEGKVARIYEIITRDQELSDR